MPAGNVWAVNTLGGYMYSLNLSNELRCQLQPLTKFRQFCDVKDASQQGKKKGDTYHWNVYKNVATQGTKLTETTTMPETQFKIVQGTLTIDEFGNSVPYTEKLDNLSAHPVKEVINKTLKHDAKKAFDNEAYTQFNATVLRVVGTSSTTVTLSTTGTTTLTNSMALGKGNVKAIVDLMKERNIPPYTADDYYSLAWPTTLRPLKNDLESIFQYSDPGFGMIMNGEIGRYENTRFIEQTNVAKSSWSNALSDWAFFFGEDTVAEAIAVPEEMRGKIPTDFGRSKGIAWYYLGGFGLVHTDAEDARVVKWDSAA
jgi:N4-gp56 family major capsid protein